MKPIFVPLTLALALASAGTPACLAQTAPAAPPSTRPAAPPADPYAGILGPEVKVLGYSVRPPKDYTPSPMPFHDQKRRDFAWQGALHQDGYVTTFVVGITRISTPEPNPEKEFMIGVFKGLARTLASPAMSASQAGTVGGLPAQRATWTGILVTPHSRLNIQGFIYIVRDGSILIAISGTDSVPSFTSTFPPLNSAALSFHK